MKLRDILPPALIDRLIWLGQTVSDAYWEFGDTANLAIDTLERYKDQIVNATNLSYQYKASVMSLGKMDCYADIGAVTGKPTRTIRYYAMVAAFYPPAMRDKYDLLPFSHFSFARQFGDKAEEVLAVSLQHAAVIGSPPSVDWLEMKFKSGYDQVQDVAANQGEYDSVYEMDSLDSLSEPDNPMVAPFRLLIQGIDRLLKASQLPKSVYDKIQLARDAILDVIAELELIR